MEFFALEPWGSAVEDHRFGTVAALIGNIHRDHKKRPTPFAWTDFFPPLDKPTPKKLDPKRVGTTLRAAFSGRIKDKRKRKDGR